jgi:phage tail sheath gpL-like
LLIGTYDPLKTGIVAERPFQILSPEDAGDKLGFGFMLHRLAKQAFQGSNGVETWVLPQAEAGGAVAAAGELDFTGTTGVVAGTIPLYLSGLSVPVTIATAATIENIADAVVAAINADADLPVTAVKVAVTFEVTLTAKSKGPWGNDISIAFSLGVNEELPAGVTVAVTDMATGAGIPTISTALDALGTGDNANEGYFTDVVHGYGQDTTTLDAISAYVGAGNEFSGLYSKTVARPFRVLTGDVATGSAGLAALIVITDLRKTDRASGVIAVPGSQSHPSEIASQAIGHMARINNDRAAQSYVGILLTGIWPGDTADRWTSEYDNRDTAVKSGISPTRVQSGVTYPYCRISLIISALISVRRNGRVSPSWPMSRGWAVRQTGKKPAISIRLKMIWSPSRWPLRIRPGYTRRLLPLTSSKKLARWLSGPAVLVSTTLFRSYCLEKVEYSTP